LAINSFIKHLPNNLNVIDIGCGFGRLAPLYLNKSKRALLTDSSKKCLSEAKVRLSKDPRVSFLYSKAENVVKKTGSQKFDLALFVRVMHHIEDPKIILKEVNRLLKKDGFFILEYANKQHIKATFMNLKRGNFIFPFEIFPEDKRTSSNQNEKCIPFLNFHPAYIKDLLTESGFEIIEVRSVSNARSRKLKKIFPHNFMLLIERFLQKPLGKIHFGPSIFVLAKKK